MIFDTLAFTHRLEEAGVDRKQAEAISSAMADIALTELATKSDLVAVKNEFKADIVEFKSDIMGAMAELRAEIHALTSKAAIGLSIVTAIILAAMAIF